MSRFAAGISWLRNLFGRGAAAEQPGTPDNGWIDVTSSWLVAYFYDDDSHTLFVRFKSGAVCQYNHVSPELWAGLQGAPSKGKYFHASGLARWPYTLVQ